MFESILLELKSVLKCDVCMLINQNIRIPADLFIKYPEHIRLPVGVDIIDFYLNLDLLSDRERQLIYNIVKHIVTNYNLENQKLILSEEGIKKQAPLIAYPFSLWQIKFTGCFDEVYQAVKVAFESAQFIQISNSEIIVLVGAFGITPRELHSIIESETLSNATLIVSDQCNQPEDIFINYQIVQELDLMRQKAYEDQCVIVYSDYIFPYIIWKVNESGCFDTLSRIGDRHHFILNDSELEHTAILFFENGLNINETAKKLYLHRNTVTYRLNRIEEITGYDLRKFNDAINFYIKHIIRKMI